MSATVLTCDPPAADAPAPLLELRGITKTFLGLHALNNVSFSVFPGETHMLLGENGAGKSTLMKVLCGAYRADAGEFYHQGRKVEITSPMDARARGIAVIFQEFSLVPYLDIAQNIFLGRAPSGRIPGTIDRAKMYRDANRILGSIGLDIDPRRTVHGLGVAQQQIVEIAKALSQHAQILVMDEPTAALSDREAELLFATMRRLKADGVAIIYISHRMAEVFALGDRITVLRDGRVVKSFLPKDATPDELVRLMVGRTVEMSYPRHFREPGEIILEVRGLAATTGIADINLTVRAGEIVGLCGLVGSGRTEVARAIFGADPVTTGEVRVFGRIRTGGPDVAAAMGLAFIPENRKAEGLVLIRSIEDNVILAALPTLFPGGLFRPGRARAVARDVVKHLNIATSSVRRTVGTLSGGNQQKVVIGKWLAARSRLFIFDEPTRGIDIGAKAQIFALIDELVQAGAGVMMISSEQSEIVHVCDRAYVMRDGRIAGQLDRAGLTEKNIVRMGIS